VAFGVDESDIDRQWVKQCCTMASMDEFMDDLPDGIDAFIGERGIRLSGGQQQRVAIARALYTRPEVMIFDEATSSLDTKSEKAIQETIYSFRGKQTLIIIAHRLSTVKACDYLIWIDNGTIRLQGKSDKVLSAYEKETVAT
jgi:ABC-type bacteriocin/lantibiotic exporter with double-glycine peptidase domain